MTINDQLPLHGVWSSRVAVFSLLLIFTSLFLHRIFYLPTATLFICLTVSYGLALLALILGIFAGVGIWRTGARGAARVFLGCSVGLSIGIVPLLVFFIAQKYPYLNDVTTSTSDPPLFKVLALERNGAANPYLYPTSNFASIQNSSYPDLVSLKINRSLQDTFDLVLETLNRFQMKLVAVEPPTEADPEGKIEAVNRTLVFGFYNDLAVRIRGNSTTAIIDLRSASRYGKSDFGYNAKLLRSILRELSTKLGMSAVPNIGDSNDSRKILTPTTPQKNLSPKKGAVDR